jgi:hypothetical protein
VRFSKAWDFAALPLAPHASTEKSGQQRRAIGFPHCVAAEPQLTSEILAQIRTKLQKHH